MTFGSLRCPQSPLLDRDDDPLSRSRGALVWACLRMPLRGRYRRKSSLGRDGIKHPPLSLQTPLEWITGPLRMGEIVPGSIRRGVIHTPPPPRTAPMGGSPPRTVGPAPEWAEAATLLAPPQTLTRPMAGIVGEVSKEGRKGLLRTRTDSEAPLRPKPGLRDPRCRPAKQHPPSTGASSARDALKRTLR